MGNLTNRKFTAAGILTLLSILALLIFALRQSNYLRSLNNKVNATRWEISQLTSFYQTTVYHTTYCRMYAESGDQTKRDSIHLTTSNLADRLTALRNHYKKQADVAHSLDSLSYYLQQRIAFSHKMLEVADSKGLSDALRFLLSGVGGIYNRQLLKITGQLEERANMLLAEFQSKQAASVTNITLYVFIIVGLCLVLLLLLIRKAQLDILLYKRTEEKLTHFNEELQAQVQSQTADLRRLTNYLQNIREEEQTRIARELHDELGQQLTVLKMEASSLKKNIGAPGEVVEKKFEDHLALIDAAIQSVRRISSDLRPLVLDELGLVAAMEGHLNEFERRTDIRTIFEHPEEVPEIPVQTQTTLFRIFQESLTNIARYAKASEVRVTLTHHKDLLQLCIQDNGVGFDPQLVKGKKTLGILGMRERCEMMGGRFTMESAPGKGTMVRVSLAI